MTSLAAMKAWAAEGGGPPEDNPSSSPPSSPARSLRTASGGNTSAPHSPLSRRPSSAGSLTSLETPPLLRRPSGVHGYTTACSDLTVLAAWAEENQLPPPADATEVEAPTPEDPNLLASAADLEVTPQELRVKVSPQSSPHRTRVLAGLCEKLNLACTKFPGSRLQLRFSVSGSTH